MTRCVAILAAACALGASQAVAEERRELGAHEHGHSVLDIAIEGGRIEMELTVPGMDIVGFERAAETDEHKAAVAQAEAILRDPLALFVLPDDAGCSIETAAVELEAEGDHENVHGEEHVEEAQSEEGEPAEEHAEREGEASHTEFHAEYAITCDSPDDLGSIEFAFFDRFPGAEEIEVTLITETGQTGYEVERDSPRIDLRGLI